MRAITELAPWERLLKRITWMQLGDISGKDILDFGSGNGVTADHFAFNNRVVAVEPSEEMLRNSWQCHQYRQICGDISALSQFADNTFDVILCHNVLEYIDDKASVVRELVRVLKPGGRLSVIKHNRAGRVMQMVVLLDDFERANDLLDGNDSVASKFGPIRYYDDSMIFQWAAELQCECCYGIRAFWDLQQNQEKHDSEAWQTKMLHLEMRVSKMEEYRNIAFFHHLLFSKNI